MLITVIHPFSWKKFTLLAGKAVLFVEPPELGAPARGTDLWRWALAASKLCELLGLSQLAGNHGWQLPQVG